MRPASPYVADPGDVAALFGNRRKLNFFLPREAGTRRPRTPSRERRVKGGYRCRREQRRDRVGHQAGPMLLALLLGAFT